MEGTPHERARRRAAARVYLMIALCLVIAGDLLVPEERRLLWFSIATPVFLLLAALADHLRSRNAVRDEQH